MSKLCSVSNTNCNDEAPVGILNVMRYFNFNPELLNFHLESIEPASGLRGGSGRETRTCILDRHGPRFPVTLGLTGFVAMPLKQ